MAMAAPLVLGACATGRMVVPAGLEPVPALEVHGRTGFNAGQNLTFGDFRVDEVSHGSTRTRREQVAMTSSHEQADERLRFRLREGSAAPVRVRCGQTAAQGRTDVPLLGEVTHGFRSALSCTVRPESDSATIWRMELTEGRASTGTLDGGGATYRIVATDRMTGTSMHGGDPTGYVFQLDGRTVAAVDVLNGGVVRIDPSLPADQRAAIAASMTALLLRADLEHELDA